MFRPIHFGEIEESDLIAALQQDRPEALGLLYDKYAPVLLGLLTRMVQHPQKAEALLQKTFLSIWVQKDQYQASGLSLLSWVILVARDTAKAALFTDKAKQFSGNKESITFTNTDNANPCSNETELRVREFCCRLEEREKTALELVYLKGNSCAEAAARLGVSVAEIKEILKMAVKHLGAEKAA